MVIFEQGRAEIAGQYLRKGSKVYIEGKLQTCKWQDQQGQDRYTTEVVVDGFDGQMQMLDSREGGGAVASRVAAMVSLRLSRLPVSKNSSPRRKTAVMVSLLNSSRTRLRQLSAAGAGTPAKPGLRSAAATAAPPAATGPVSPARSCTGRWF